MSSNSRYGYRVLDSLQEELDALRQSLEKNVTFQEQQQRTTPPRNRNVPVQDHSSLEGEAFARSEGTGNNRRDASYDEMKQSSRSHYNHVRDFPDDFGEGRHAPPATANPTAPWSSLHCSTVDSVASLEEQPELATHGDDRRTRAPSVSTSTHNKPTTTSATRSAAKASLGDSDFASPFAQQSHGQHASYPQPKELYANDRAGNGLHAGIDESPPQEPPDIVSPPFRMFSPSLNRSSRSATSSAKKGPRGVPLQTPPSEWEPMLEDMKSVLKQKDEQILSLVDENDYLRAQLQRLQQRLDASVLLEQQQQPPPPQPTRTPPTSMRSPKYESYEQQQRGPPASARRSTAAASASPHTTNTRNRRVFSPGTQFVAELATMMEIEVGHHAPLSFLVDKHWDKFAKKYGYDGYDE